MRARSPIMQYMKRRSGRSILNWIVTAVIVVAVIGGVTFVALNVLRPRVQVTRLVEGPVVQAFYSTGTVHPVREFPIKANHAGIVTKMLVDKGDPIKLGQPLAVVEEQTLTFGFDKAQAELKEKLARADDKTSPVLKEFDAKITATGELLEIAKREQSRVTGLIERNAATAFDLDRAMDRAKLLWSELESLKAQRATKVLELQREVDVAKSAVSVAQWNLDQQNILSPTDGVVLDRPVSLGTRLAINDHIMQIADVRPANLVMRAQVDEEDKIKVSLAQPVRMTLYSFPGEVFLGKVTRIYDKADESRRTFEIDVTLTEPNPKFSAGMTGELAFIMAEKGKAAVIPSQSLQQDRVFVVRQGKIEQADVTIGLKSVERVEIVSGLAPNDQVLISPIGTMNIGQAVRIQEVDPTAAANLNKKAAVDGNFKGFN